MRETKNVNRKKHLEKKKRGVVHGVRVENRGPNSKRYTSAWGGEVGGKGVI